jgi:neutral amino acid transport system substrate-binding protein
MAASPEAPVQDSAVSGPLGPDREERVLGTFGWRQGRRLRQGAIVLATLLGCQAMAAAQMPRASVAVLLPTGPDRARVSFLDGFQLGQDAVRSCGLKPLIPDWRPFAWDGDPLALFPSGTVPSLVVAPYAADLRAFSKLAEISDARVLLPLQRGASLQGLKGLDAGGRLWPLVPSREEDYRALATDALKRGWKRLVVVRDPTTLQGESAAAFVELFQGDGGQVLSYNETLLQDVDPSRPEQLSQLAQDLAWLAPDAMVLAAPPDGALAQALRQAQRQGEFVPAHPAWIWLLPADQAARLPSQDWPQLALKRPAVGPGWAAFANRFQQRFGQEPDQLAAAGYETARVLALSTLAPSPVSSEGTRDPLGWIDPDAEVSPLCEAMARRRDGQRVRLEGVASRFDLRAGQAPSGRASTRLIAAQ